MTTPEKTCSEFQNPESLFLSQEEIDLYCNLMNLQSAIEPSLLKKTSQYEEVEKDDGKNKMDLFLKEFRKCMSIDKSDSLTIQYLSINSKKNKQKLVSEILELKNEFLLILPYCVRIVANLNKQLSEFGQYLSQKAFEDYYRLKEKWDKNMEKTSTKVQRVKNLRILCEMIKFNIIDGNKILDILKDLIEDFNGLNIELSLVIFDQCGSYLASLNETKLRFKFFFEFLTNVKEARKFPSAIDHQIENALVMSKPIKVTKMKPEKKFDEEETFIHWLLSEGDKKFPKSEIHKCILSLPWAQSDFTRKFIKIFLKVVKIANMNKRVFLANILEDLNVYYPELVCEIIDTLEERIIFGLEKNIFTERQKRVSLIKFFGTLHPLLITFDEQQKMLKLLITYLTPEPKDPPNDQFRIILVCELLETLKGSVGKLKQKALFGFLIEFQKYILTKKYIPSLVEFQILDTIDMYAPNLPRFTSVQSLEKFLSEKKNQKIEQIIENDNSNSTSTKRLKEQIGDDGKFDEEFSVLIEESLTEVKNFQVKPQTKPLNQHLRKGTAEKEKKEGTFQLISRTGNKLIAKPIQINEDSKIVKSLRHHQDTEMKEKIESSNKAKIFHNQQINEKPELYGMNGISGNEQIKIIFKLFFFYYFTH